MFAMFNVDGKSYGSIRHHQITETYFLLNSYPLSVVLPVEAISTQIICLPKPMCEVQPHNCLTYWNIGDIQYQVFDDRSPTNSGWTFVSIIYI